MHASIPSFRRITPVLLCLGLLISGCMFRANEPQQQSPPTVVPAPPSLLVLHHGDDVDGKMCFQQVQHTLQYTKIPYDTVDLATASNLPDLTPYRVVVITTERFGTLSIAEARRLLQFVREGGGLAVLFRGWHPILGTAFGRPTAFDPDFMSLLSERLELHGHLMPGAEGLTIDSLSLSMLDFEAEGSFLNSTATVLATARTSGRPVAWLHSFGQGRTVFWNSGLLTVKSFRGAIIQSIAAVQPLSVRPIANWGAMYLDDFPSPGVSTKMEPISSELGLSAADFYAKRWYPDMRQLADSFGVKYTSTVIYAYNGSVTAPYPFNEWLGGRVVMGGEVFYYSPWIAQRDSEISEMAFHGYNHQSLLVENWTSAEPMVEALIEARERWLIEDFAPLPATYVPPMNEIDSTGMRALTRAFPSINTVAGLYSGEFELGQDREFGPEPWNDSLYALPRNTSGFIQSPLLKLSMISLLEVAGIWGHFVHPDEVYPNEDRYESMRELGIDVPEGGFQWYGEPDRDGLFYQFKEWLQFARAQYPWLRYMKAQEALSTMKAYQNASWRWDLEGSDLQIRTTQTPFFFVVYSSQGASMTSIDGGDLLQTTETGLLTKFVVRATAPLVTIQLAPSSDVFPS